MPGLIPDPLSDIGLMWSKGLLGMELLVEEAAGGEGLKCNKCVKLSCSSRLVSNVRVTD